MDMEPGREGGTWLAANEHGKIAALLNEVTAKISPNKKGRGFLVSDYLLTRERDAVDYLRRIAENGKMYNPFNLVTIDIG